MLELIECYWVSIAGTISQWMVLVRSGYCWLCHSLTTPIFTPRHPSHINKQQASSSVAHCHYRPVSCFSIHNQISPTSPSTTSSRFTTAPLISFDIHHLPTPTAPISTEHQHSIQAKRLTVNANYHQAWASPCLTLLREALEYFDTAAYSRERAAWS